MFFRRHFHVFLHISVTHEDIVLPKKIWNFLHPNRQPLLKFLFRNRFNLRKFLEERAYLGPGLEVAESLGPSHFNSSTCPMNTNNMVVSRIVWMAFKLISIVLRKVLIVIRMVIICLMMVTMGLRMVSTVLKMTRKVAMICRLDNKRFF